MKLFSEYTYDDWMEHIMAYPHQRRPKEYKPVLHEVSNINWILCFQVEIPKQFRTPELVLAVKLLS